MERMERNIIIERGECSCTHALEKVDELFGPAVSFRALTCVPLGCTDDDWPDTKEIYQRLVAVAEMIGGNYPDVVIQGQDIIEISYISRLGNSEFRWAAGTYTVACNPASSLLYNMLDRQDCTEILTEGSGHCYLHRPNTSENPEGCWVFAPEGGDWCHRYESLDELIRAEAGDWLQVNGAIVTHKGGYDKMKKESEKRLVTRVPDSVHQALKVKIMLDPRYGSVQTFLQKKVEEYLAETPEEGKK